MGAYIDRLRLVSVGFLIAGAVAYTLTLAGLSPVAVSGECLSAFFSWAIIAQHWPSVPGHSWFVTLGSPSIPQSSPELIRRLLRTGSPDALRRARSPSWKPRNVLTDGSIAIFNGQQQSRLLSSSMVDGSSNTKFPKEAYGVWGQ